LIREGGKIPGTFKVEIKENGKDWRSNHEKGKPYSSLHHRGGGIRLKGKRVGSKMKNNNVDCKLNLKISHFLTPGGGWTAKKFFLIPIRKKS